MRFGVCRSFVTIKLKDTLNRPALRSDISSIVTLVPPLLGRWKWHANVGRQKLEVWESHSNSKLGRIIRIEQFWTATVEIDSTDGRLTEESNDQNLSVLHDDKRIVVFSG